MDRQAGLNHLKIPTEQLELVNRVLLNPDLDVMSNFLDVVEKYGTPEEINRQAQRNGSLPILMEKLAEVKPEYLADLAWLLESRQQGAFISVEDYRRKVHGERAASIDFREKYAVTLEISACQYFSWLMDIARRAASRGEIVPGRFIRVRNMQEQERDGDLISFAAAMQIIGASYAEQPDTRGSDGSNLHLGGADTLIGYFGGVGQPNDYALKWLDEYLYYYTRYGVRQVLNVNNGTVLLAYLLHRLGVDIEFKISVTLGTDNPYSALWALIMARLFARPDGATPLVGLNWSNSVNKATIEIAAQMRRELGLEDTVRFEHHVTETWRGLVVQPYNRRQDVLDLADHVANISAKHEGGEPQVETGRVRPSDVNDYYRLKDEIVASGDWEHVSLNFYDKYDSLNATARALTERGLAFTGARNLHHR